MGRRVVEVSRYGQLSGDNAIATCIGLVCEKRVTETLREAGLQVSPHLSPSSLSLVEFFLRTFRVCM